MALAVAVAQEAQAVPVAPEEEAAQSHAAWAGAWPPTELPAPCLSPVVECPGAVQRAAVAPALWASRAAALFS